jgi:hypothetical protein
MGDRPRSPVFDVLEWRGKLTAWTKSTGHVMHIIVEGSSQMGGNHQLLRVYMDDNVGLA